MAKQTLKRHIETHFGIGLEEYIRHHHQVKLQTRAEIAENLNVSPKVIGKLIKEFGIKRADGFKRRFQNKYGEHALEVFQKMIERQGASLSDVSKHFGFSRQYSSDVFKKIYGRRLRELRGENKLAEHRNPNHTTD